ncbi:MAG: peptide deformylase, partial [Solobacterium sp.]|nr:peptide deformylase [Solobacterium sp.]
GYIAIVLQHELDHMDGILFYDHINKKEPNKPIEGALVL